MNTSIENNTAVREVYHGWKSPPNVRGTSDIIFVCVTTIFLCVYTAIHPNIPAPGEKERYRILRKAKWVLVAVLAPEIALNAAWTQFCEARALSQELRRIHQEALQSGRTASAEQNVVESLPDAGIFDMTYGFYAVMGGLRIKVDNDMRINLVTNNMDSLMVMPSAVVRFARAGIWWDVDHSTIMDKSKADHIAKSLVVLQLTWMCAQCIARAVIGLPLTLLELHTFIHAICAATMFGIWFKKPLNIQEAMIKATNPNHQEISAKMIAELYHDRMFQKENGRHPEVPLTTRRVNIGFASNPALAGLDDHPQTFKNTSFWSIINRELIGNIVGHDVNHLGGRILPLAFVLIQVAYGGIHLTAWHFAFPTVFELWAWRATSICIASFMPLVVLSFFLSHQWQLIRFWGVGWLFWTFVSMVLILLGFASRVFIVVEAFISLRAVPAGIYEAIPWANYIPHI